MVAMIVSVMRCRASISLNHWFSCIAIEALVGVPIRGICNGNVEDGVVTIVGTGVTTAVGIGEALCLSKRCCHS